MPFHRLECSLRGRRHHGIEHSRRRALELLAGCGAEGCPEGIMRARGFSIDFMVDLVRTGLATATSERVVMGSATIEVARLRITEEGRRVLRVK